MDVQIVWRHPGGAQGRVTYQVYLFGAKRAYQSGWVYRLDGCAVSQHESATAVRNATAVLSRFPNIVVFYEGGQVQCANAPAYFDPRTHEALTWAQLSYLISHYEHPARPGTVQTPVSDADCNDAFLVFVELCDSDDDSWSVQSSP